MTEATLELDLACHETIDDDDDNNNNNPPPKPKRVRWNAPSPSRKIGLQKRWESARVVFCIGEDVQMVAHDGSCVKNEVVVTGSCYGTV